MKKYIITFGIGQLPNFNGNPLDVMLVVEAPSSSYAQDTIKSSSIGGNFCGVYLRTDEIVEEFIQCGMREYTLKEIGYGD